MPGLVRKLLVVAAVDALFLQPHTHRTQQPVPGIQISYGKTEIRSASTAFPGYCITSPHLEAHGVVGILIPDCRKSQTKQTTRHFHCSLFTLPDCNNQPKAGRANLWQAGIRYHRSHFDSALVFFRSQVGH